MNFVFGDVDIIEEQSSGSIYTWIGLYELSHRNYRLNKKADKIIGETFGAAYLINEADMTSEALHVDHHKLNFVNNRNFNKLHGV